MENYEDRVILKLKRQYSKDETVQALTKKLKEVETELGVVTSERDEAISEVASFKKLTNDQKSVFCQELYVRNLKEEVKSLRSVIRSLKIENERLMVKLNQDQHSS